MGFVPWFVSIAALGGTPRCIHEFTNDHPSFKCGRLSAHAVDLGGSGGCSHCGTKDSPLVLYLLWYLLGKEVRWSASSYQPEVSWLVLLFQSNFFGQPCWHIHCSVVFSLFATVPFLERPRYEYDLLCVGDNVSGCLYYSGAEWNCEILCIDRSMLLSVAPFSCIEPSGSLTRQALRNSRDFPVLSLSWNQLPDFSALNSLVLFIRTICLSAMQMI